MRMKRMMAQAALVLWGVLALAVSAQARSLYVSPNGGDVYPYSDWKTAATDIQSAVDAAKDGDTVQLAPGTYYPESEIYIAKSVVVRGAKFAAFGQPASVIDGSEKHRAFYLDGTSGAKPVVEMVGIKNGYSGNAGGGVYLSGEAILRMSVLWENAGAWGGAVCCEKGGRVESCLAGENEAEAGGGIYCRGEGSVARANLLLGNSAIDRGGGLCLEEGAVGVENAYRDNRAEKDPRSADVFGTEEESKSTGSYDLPDCPECNCNDMDWELLNCVVQFDATSMCWARYCTWRAICNGELNYAVTETLLWDYQEEPNYDPFDDPYPWHKPQPQPQPHPTHTRPDPTPSKTPTPSPTPTLTLKYIQEIQFRDSPSIMIRASSPEQAKQVLVDGLKHEGSLCWVGFLKVIRRTCPEMGSQDHNNVSQSRKMYGFTIELDDHDEPVISVNGPEGSPDITMFGPKPFYCWYRRHPFTGEWGYFWGVKAEAAFSYEVQPDPRQNLEWMQEVAGSPGHIEFDGSGDDWPYYYALDPRRDGAWSKTYKVTGTVKEQVTWPYMP